eukprot:TRINITY_DN576_c0_g1_i5.p1 TRINITY_DN576_c0_g1~~TRINITY_DN576_c0_g1_i5.p1  ORF type:complete len:203 (-),score=38.44 TRINITY_DN576_c0_g1_i5:107-715(-)
MDDLTEHYFEKAVRFLSQNLPDIFQVNLASHNITADKAKVLASALASNTVLKSLDLYGNTSLGPKGAEVLAGAFAKLESTQLTELDMSKCGLGDDGIKTIAQGLKNNTGLTELDLSGNHFGNEGLKSLSECLRNKSHINELILHDNLIEDPEPLIDVLADKQFLTKLWINKNKISASKVQKLKKAFVHLQRLQVDENLDQEL